jgi:CysZ protein
MNGVLPALARAAASLLHPKLLLLSLLPILAAVMWWSALLLAFWSPLNATLTGWLNHSPLIEWMLDATRVLFHSDAAGLVPDLAIVLILLAWWPLIQGTALLLTAVFMMPALVNHVALRDYPGLERRHGGTFLRSAANAAFGLAVFLFLWVVTLPLWLVPGAALVLPLVLSAYLNQRMFCYDALAEHADAAELYAVLHRHRVGRYALGGLLGALNYVPLFGWFAQVYIGLAFIHWGLARVHAMRAAAAAHQGQ